MTEDEIVAQAEEQDLRENLGHPDPDPDNLPAIIPPHLIEQEQTAAHLLRASIRLDYAIQQTKDRMEMEMAAWGADLEKLQGKREAWRDIVKAWMLRNNVTQIKCPWFTASIAKGRTKKVVVDEEKALAVCKEMYPKAVKVKESLVKAEFDVACDTFPSAFKDLFTEETSEPSLLVRKAKE